MGSAHAVLSHLIALTNPNSVIDVGCGQGCWLAVLRGIGITDILGIDGPWVDLENLEIPPSNFRVIDLTQPFRIERSFDLALSLEVAEHLPPSSAAGFIESLTRTAPVVYFSAAIPFQGGNRHKNEQWPDYWADLFGRHGYLPVDCVRGRIWGNPDVEWWYAQNGLVFASPTAIENNPVLRREHANTDFGRLSMVHPRQYLAYAAPSGWCVRTALRLLVVTLGRAARRRARNWFGLLSGTESPAGRR